MVDPGLIEDVGRRHEESIAPPPSASSTDELRRNREYFTGSTWRDAVTLDRLAAACGPLHETTVLDIGAFPGHLAAMLSRNDREQRRVDCGQGAAMNARAFWP